MVSPVLRRRAPAATGLVVLAASVTPLAAQVRPGEADESRPEPAILEATVAPGTVYVGQAVRLRARFLFSEQVQRRLRRAPEYELPSPAGFWVRELSDGGPTVRRIGDTLYDERVFQRIYFPLRPGPHTLPPVTLYYETRGDLLTPVRRRVLRSDSLRILVRPVPDAGRPASFTGAVGRFRLRAWIEPERVDAGGAAVLTLEVEGSGNIRTLPPPAVPGSVDARVYPPTEHADVRVVGNELVGTKRFRWVVVPEEAGRLEIDPVAYGFFDPQRERFDVARAAPVTLRVDGGAATSATIGPARPAPSPDRWSWLHAPATVAVLALPLLGLVGTAAVRRWRDAPAGWSRRALRRRRRVFAALHERATRPDRTFFRDLDRAFRAALAERLDDSTLRAAPADHIRFAVEAAGVEPRRAGGAAALVARLERARYSPDSPGPAEAARYALAAEQLLGELEKTRPRRSGVAAASRLLPVLACAAAVLIAVFAIRAVAGPPDADGGGEFRAGVAAYATGEYEEAAERFRTVVERRPRDAHAWYNLGNAHFRLGRRGPAMHAWLHAIRLAPRDGGVRRNLIRAAVPAASLDYARPWPPASADELRFLLAALWLLGSSLLLAGVLRRTRWPRRVGVLALAPAVLIAGLLATDHTREPAFVTIADDAALRAAPIHRARTLRDLPPGTVLRRETARGDWLRVTAPGGARGWIAMVQVGRL